MKWTNIQVIRDAEGKKNETKAVIEKIMTMTSPRFKKHEGNYAGKCRKKTTHIS